MVLLVEGHDMTGTVKLDLFSATVKEDIAKLPKQMLEWAEEALNEACDLIVGLAQVNVRVDTGSLRDSIRKERGGKGEHWRVFRVRAGGYVVNPKTGKLVNYAAVVEAKYPFLRPAVENVLPQIRTMIENKVVEKVG